MIIKTRGLVNNTTSLYIITVILNYVNKNRINYVKKEIKIQKTKRPHVHWDKSSYKQRNTEIQEPKSKIIVHSALHEQKYGEAM